MQALLLARQGSARHNFLNNFKLTSFFNLWLHFVVFLHLVMLSRIARPARFEQPRTLAFAGFLRFVDDVFNVVVSFAVTYLCLLPESGLNPAVIFVLVGVVLVTVELVGVEQLTLVVLKFGVIVTLSIESNSYAQFTVRDEKRLFVHLSLVFEGRQPQPLADIVGLLHTVALHLEVLHEPFQLHLKAVSIESFFVDELGLLFMQRTSLFTMVV